MTNNNAKKHLGGCHCGAVRFEVVVDASHGTRCNCSICTKVNGIGAIVKPDDLVLTAGEDALSTYAWGGKTATRFFCKHCGVRSFGRGHVKEIGGDYVAVQLGCLDNVDVAELIAAPVRYADGRNNNWWEAPTETQHL